MFPNVSFLLHHRRRESWGHRRHAFVISWFPSKRFRSFFTVTNSTCCASNWSCNATSQPHSAPARLILEPKKTSSYFYSIIVSFKYSVETHIVWKHIYAQRKCTWNHWPWILQLHHKPIQPYPTRLVSLQFFIDLRQFLALHKRTSAVSGGPTGDREDGESADTTTITTFNSRSIGTGISNLTKARNICILFDSTSI